MLYRHESWAMSVHPRPLHKYCHHIVAFTRSQEEQYCRRQSHAGVMGPINIYTDKLTDRQQTLWEDERTSERQASPSLYFSLPSSPPYQKDNVFTPKYAPREHLFLGYLPCFSGEPCKGCLHWYVLDRAYSLQEQVVVLGIQTKYTSARTNLFRYVLQKPWCQFWLLSKAEA